MSSTPHSVEDSDTDSLESFHSLHSDPTPSIPKPAPDTTTPPPAKAVPIERFSPEEEANLIAESNSLKGAGNTQFGKSLFENAIQTYDRALASCPSYLDYELAVLRSNIAACYIKLSEWKEAVESAEKGIDNLERLEPLPQPARTSKKDGGETVDDGDVGVEEVDDETEARIDNLQKSGHSIAQVRNLQIKLLLRRAKAKTELGGWASLQGAEEDYKVLLAPLMLPCLSPTDRRTVTESARQLAPRLNQAREQEMAEMMGKLKGLGNSILKPFGLSTENFQFVKDEKSGGYSMNFNQGPGNK